jgi:hypothetical protein
MKRTLILLFILISSLAQAGVNLVIEHPRNPSNNNDSYEIACDKKCAINIVAMNPVNGELDQKFESVVKQLWSLALPDDAKIRSHRLLYKVEAQDGEKKIQLNIGYPEMYQGEELAKYLGVISYIENVKRSMRSGLEAGKK